MSQQAAPGSGRRVVRVVFLLFCLEIGLILLLLPWTLLWDNNFFVSLFPQWSRFWLNSYVRGGVSGLGLVNLWIAISEAFRLAR
ncbi:MAG: hypothetical protein H6509_05435 [Bryobacterales bacterium]|nr:hypothetical protein [Acidobacteriota bacterium]MCB9384035.1 hypothetical protein [Bryobacterales bacterium]